MASSVVPAGYLGDFAYQQTVDLFFNTVDQSDSPSALTTPTAAVYKANDTTQTTTGVTVTASFDGADGLNHIRIVTTNAFYVSRETYNVVLTGGSVPSTGATVAGSPVGSFSIENRAASRKLAGITSLAGWLRSIIRRDAPDALTRKEINDGGGTYDATKHSLEAQADE